MFTKGSGALENMNADCFCVSLDAAGLQSAIEADPAAQGLHGLIAERCPNLFAALPVFVSRRHVDEMAAVVAAVETVVALPAYREAALARAPDIARHDPGTPSVFMGYDFHLGADGPRLIEINTNAGGALLNALLARAQRACCEDVATLVNGPVPAADLEQSLFDMFVAEWRAAGRAGTPARIAIVDEAPQEQFLYPEFLLFAQLFRRFGVDAAVLSPEDLRFEDGALRDAHGPIDFVYNRLTDFPLASAANAALRAAYLAGAIVLSPHPRAHALYADKRNLSLLTDGALLRGWGVEEATIAVFLRGIARTRLVSASDAEALWPERRKLFFKPAAGYGSKAAYRGDKLTKRVWADIVEGTYVAQELIAPSERAMSAGVALKADIRNYVYAGEVQLIAARLYQGQTTNFRTPGGGFAPILTTPAEDIVVKEEKQSELPVAVIGAGPAGLAAAAHLAARGIPFVVFERGRSVGENLAGYGHVKLFSPWQFNTDRAAVKLLEAEGWKAPEPSVLPTAGELVAQYLEPLSRTTALASHIYLGARVLAVSRASHDKVKSADREGAPFVLQVESAGRVSEHRARAVIDASGTWSQPNPLGAHGLPALGERERADRIAYGMPDILGSERARYAGKKVLVVGAGHSAAGNLIALAHLAGQAPRTRIAWAVRGRDLRRLFGGGANDGLPARGALGTQLQKLVSEGRLELHLGFRISRLEDDAGHMKVFADEGSLPAIEGVDEIIGATGSRPDFGLARELRLRLDPMLESTEALAPLIDPNVHSCGTVRPHGHRELAHPEPGFYAIGAKSYGRAPNFLMATGYEQARSVVAALAGDLAAADDVQLELPETGVCSTDFAVEAEGAPASACCGGPAMPAKAPDPIRIAAPAGGGCCR
jgi:hypothetical protein